MPDPITIVLADDHPLFREGVAQALRAEHGIDVLAQASTADEAVSLVTDLLPDLVLLDIHMPGDGLAAAARLAEVAPATKIVMLTVSEADMNLLAALTSGARGYVLKGVSARELIHILRAIHAGESYVPPSLAAAMLTGMTHRRAENAQPQPRALLESLTERERQILECVAAGMSNKESGFRLGITEKTVKHYVTNILAKLQVRNRVEAALLAERSAKPG